MSGTYPSGILVGDGNPNQPTISFLNQPATGIFCNSEQSIGISIEGVPTAEFTSKQLVLQNGLAILKNPKDNSFLRGDAKGNASWAASPIQSGTFSWDTIYNTVSLNSVNNSVHVNLPSASAAPSTLPSVVISQETDVPVADNTFYITNKSNNGFDVYSTLPVFSNIVEASSSSMVSCRLSNGAIGVAYYDTNLDRIRYTYSLDNLGKSWSSPITVDDVSAINLVSLAVVNGNPAVVYIYDEGLNDEWRYSRATNANGSSWEGPVTLATSSISVSFLPVTLNLQIVTGEPALFLNNEHGRAQMIISNDSNGDTWGSPINISNLNNHQILDVLVVNNNPAVVAKSNTINNVYYVIANDNRGTSWPVGATQLYKNNGNTRATIVVNGGRDAASMFFMGDTLCIVLSELETNIMYISSFNFDNSSWNLFHILAQTSTSVPFPKFFTNNGNYYMLFNYLTASPSAKKLITFTTPTDFTVQNSFLSVFNLYADHIVLPNINDDNSTIIFISDQNISLLRFYENNFKINWIAHTL
jgi:hypothetical protein